MWSFTVYIHYTFIIHIAIDHQKHFFVKSHLIKMSFISILLRIIFVSTFFVILVRIYRSLMKKSEKNKSLYSLHAKLLLNLENLNLKDLRILLIESSLFRIDEKDMVSILFTPESGRSLLKLATNVEQTSSSRLGNYSLINNSQVYTAF